MRRVVITGMGMVGPLGMGVEHSWKRLIAGESGAARVSRIDVSDIASQIACEIPRGDGSNGTFNPDQWMDPKDQRKVDEFIVYGLAAAGEALRDANWAPESHEDQTRTGVLVGSGIGGIGGIYDASVTLLEKGPRRISPFFVPSNIINMVAGNLSIRYGIKGPNYAIVSACSTGAHCIGLAARTIERGEQDAIIAGGAEFAVYALHLVVVEALAEVVVDADPEAIVDLLEGREAHFRELPPERHVLRVALLQPHQLTAGLLQRGGPFRRRVVPAPVEPLQFLDRVLIGVSDPQQELGPVFKGPRRPLGE